MEETAKTEVFFEMPVEFLEKSEPDTQPRRCVEGYASTEALDHDGEQVLQKGIDFSYLISDGYINYDHQRRNIGGVRVPMIIGYPTDAMMKSHGLWAAGELLTGDPMASEQLRLANEMWELGMALKKSGGHRKLAYSVEGPPPVKRGNKIVSCQVMNLALTHKPVNSTCSVELFAKSMCCGKCSPTHPDYNPAHHGCHNKHVEFEDGLPHLMAVLGKALTTENSGPVSVPRPSPLMAENLDRGLTTVLYGDKPCDNHYDATGHFHKGIAGAVDHMTGCLGYNRQAVMQLFKRLLDGAGNNQEIATLMKAAGCIKRY